MAMRFLNVLDIVLDFLSAQMGRNKTLVPPPPSTQHTSHPRGGLWPAVTVGEFVCRPKGSSSSCAPHI